MSEEDDPLWHKPTNWLAPLQQGTQLDVARRGSHLVSRAAKDALSLLPSLVEKRWRVGEYELLDQDYRQILIWLEQLRLDGREMSVEEFLDKAAREKFKCPIEFHCEGHFIGRLKCINLSGLGFSHLSLVNCDSLNELWCEGNRFTELALACVPNLTILYCGFNKLTGLDLAGMPCLTWLACNNNQLTELDLASVPGLGTLHCGANRLTELHLASVPSLISLFCRNNQLTKLDLASVPRLMELDCDGNQLTELNLTSVPALGGCWWSDLDCSNNPLTELDIRCCPEVRNVICDPGVLVLKRSNQTVTHPK